MDFSFTEDQQSFFELAKQILSDHATHEKMKALEKGDGPRFDPGLWQELGKAGLIGAAAPEAYGGAGFGFVELAGILEQVGRTAAPVPLYETNIFGILPILHFGSDEQQSSLLPQLASGEFVFTAAFTETQQPPTAPETLATRTNDGWNLQGLKICVPYGQVATHIIVPATTDEGGVIAAIVPTATAGITMTTLDTTNDHPEVELALEGVEVNETMVLGDPSRGREIIEWILLRANAALSIISFGVCDEAVRLTAEYLKSRKQFDQPIGTFQAAGHRAADAYIDTEGIRLTAWQAAWRISEGLPAEKEVAVAKSWAAEAGQRVVHAAVHLHGGMGVDRDYPLPRYFLYAKQLELSLGGTSQQLLTLGSILAEES